MPRKPVFQRKPTVPMRPFGRTMPAGAMARMRNNPVFMARQARTRSWKSGARQAQAQPRAGMREMPFEEIREKPEPRRAGLKPEWQQSFWFQIPFLGSFVDLLRSLVFPQENLRATKRAFVGTGLGSIAKKRAMARLEQKQALRQRALEQKNSAPALENTAMRGQARTANSRSKKAA